MRGRYQHRMPDQELSVVEFITQVVLIVIIGVELISFAALIYVNTSN